MHRRSAKGRYAKPLAALKRDVTGNSTDKETANFLTGNMLKWGAPPRAQYSCQFVRSLFSTLLAMLGTRF